ncbi:hypothetical protein GCM10027447_28230 [Glycomyces halotolerans]
MHAMGNGVHGACRIRRNRLPSARLPPADHQYAGSDRQRAPKVNSPEFSATPALGNTPPRSQTSLNATMPEGSDDVVAVGGSVVVRVHLGRDDTDRETEGARVELGRLGMCSVAVAECPIAPSIV